MQACLWHNQMPTPPSFTRLSLNPLISLFKEFVTYHQTYWILHDHPFWRRRREKRDELKVDEGSAPFHSWGWKGPTHLHHIFDKIPIAPFPCCPLTLGSPFLITHKGYLKPFWYFLPKLMQAPISNLFPKKKITIYFLPCRFAVLLWTQSFSFTNSFILFYQIEGTSLGQDLHPNSIHVLLLWTETAHTAFSFAFKLIETWLMWPLSPLLDETNCSILF